jgi:hypothetical protein
VAVCRFRNRLVVQAWLGAQARGFGLALQDALAAEQAAHPIPLRGQPTSPEAAHGRPCCS